MIRIEAIDALREQSRGWRAKGFRIGLVPTMGALHEGHLSLIDQIRPRTQRVIVTIFVNPKQFGPKEDFNQYPRTLNDDLAQLKLKDVDAVFIPSVKDMYPDDNAATISVPRINVGLCDAHRENHFDGVATIVAKLFNQAEPDDAIFGQKDYQQLVMLKQLAKDLNFPVNVLDAPIYREKSGLAASSRNKYLTDDQRTIAGAIYATLIDAKNAAKTGKDLRTIEAESIDRLLKKGFDSVDYFSFRDAGTLGIVDTLAAPIRLLTAARIGKTRLIDNIAV